MLTKKTKVFWDSMALLVLAYCAVPGNGTVVHVIDVPTLVESSELIVTGRIVSVIEQGTTTINTFGEPLLGKKLLAVLSADETLKGRVEGPNLSIEFVTTEAPSGIQGIPRGQYGIFFLHGGSSGYTVSDPIYPFLPAVPNGRITSGPPLERVIAKLGELLGYAPSTEIEASSALGALSRIPGDAATQTLRHALETSSGDLQLRIASKLVARNDINGLPVVERALIHPAESRDYLLPILANSLAGLKDPRSVPTLKRLLQTNDPHIIKSVAIALRQSGSTDALGPLSHLLSSSDEQVKYYAVVGLGEITRQDEWTPAFDEFRQNEAKYISYWRNWATSNLAHYSPE